MKRGLAVLRVAAMLGAAAPGAPAQEEQRTVTGVVTSITVDDPTEMRAISKEEKRMVVRVELDGVDDIVLGFGEPGRPLEAQREMFDVLLAAMEKGWTVTLRLNREITSRRGTAFGRIVSVTVKP
jgi:hypothetical protein